MSKTSTDAAPAGSGGTRRRWPLLALAALVLAGGLYAARDPIAAMVAGDDRMASARDFPKAKRPVAKLGPARYSDEESRDRLNEAVNVMDVAQVEPGMSVADIGAGEGYYTIRLAERVGIAGRVLAQDIQPKVIEALADRVARERLDNVAVKLGAVDDPKLPDNSFDRVFMIHMYHEIAEPYAFLWRLRPALRAKGEVVVVDADRLTTDHGTPPQLLFCEFKALGYRLAAFDENLAGGAYVARFVTDGARPAPDQIKPCTVSG